jgi:thymidylate synthase (FAD)
MHKVTLDWVTPDAERVIAKHARVSTKVPDRVEFASLIRYCVRHGHWSIFQQASLSFEVITSRSISPQILRHSSLSFQETSQRYCDPLDVLEEAEASCWDFDLRRQDPTNRQNSTEDLDIELAAKYKQKIYDTYWIVKQLYKDMLEDGIAKECARGILPLCTPTRLHMSGTLRSFIHYVGVRASSETQLEHRLIAIQLGKILCDIFPTVTDALKISAESDHTLRGWLSI